MIRNSLIILTFLFSSIGSNIAQPIFRAYSDAKQVVSGHYFQVSFTLENAKGSGFKAPSFIDFDVAGGPSTSSQISIVNGRRSQKMTYTYSLVGEKIGKYTIGPAEINADGSILKTQPIQIEVVKGKATAAKSQTTSNPAEGELYLEASLEYDTAYVGQQLTLRYDLITNLDVRSAVISQAPAFDGFYAQELQNANVQAERIVRDGVQYIRRPVKVYALFPQQKGVFNIDAAQSIAGISDGSRSNNFFFSRRLKQVRAKSEPFTITVQDLPKPAPISFSGAVGKFRMGTSIDKKSVTMDDAVTLTMQIQGVGDGKFVEAPEQTFKNQWDIYEPNLLADNQKVVGAEIRYTKTFEYLMIPKKEGRQSIRPEFTYYDVDSARYMTIRSNPMTINVLKGSGRELADIQEQELIVAPIYSTSNLKDGYSTLAFSPLHYALNGILLFSALGLVWRKRKLVQEANIDPELLRRQKAQQLAIEKLSNAKQALDQNKIEDFYIQLRQSLTKYLADKTSLDSDQLSKSDIDELLSQYSLSEHGTDIQDIMEKGEQALYASIRPGNEETTYEKTKQIILDIETSLSV